MLDVASQTVASGRTDSEPVGPERDPGRHPQGIVVAAREHTEQDGQAAEREDPGDPERGHLQAQHEPVEREEGRGARRPGSRPLGGGDGGHRSTR